MNKEILKMGKKKRVRLTEKKKKLVYITGGIILLVAILFLIIQSLFNPMADAKKLALTRSEVPSSFILSSDASETGFMDNSYWVSKDDKKEAFNSGFKGGYYGTYVYVSPRYNASIYNKVHIFNNEENTKRVFDLFREATSLTLNCIQFDTSDLGKDSLGCYQKMDFDWGTEALSWIVFYKDNVLATVRIRVSGDQSAAVDETIGYAKVIEEKI